MDHDHAALGHEAPGGALDAVHRFFTGEWNFMPHGHCYLWKPPLVGLHVVSDVLIGLAYFGISLQLYLLVKRVKLPFSPMILAFGVFIGACGLTHLVEVWNVWHGAYWLAGFVKAITAIASVATALYVVPIKPKVLRLTEQAALAEQRRFELEKKNIELEQLYSYRSLAEVMPQIVWTATPAGITDYFNHRWFEYTGLTAQESQARGWQAVLHSDDAQLFAERWAACVREESPYEVEHRVLRGIDGAYRWHLCRALPMRDQHGRVAKWFGTSTDIHDTKLREEEAKRISEFNERLVGIVGHDVRSPVAASLATTEQLLSQPELEPKLRRPVERIHRSVVRISKLIDLLLDYTRARVGGGIPLTFRDVSLKEICNKAVEEAQAGQPARTFELQCDDEYRGRWDPERLGQVLSNLLENAAKYGAQSTPIRLQLSGDALGVELRVHNQGEPIPPEVMPTLFQPFRRGPQTESTIKVSMGLGLYIVRELVEGHGGTVDVKSETTSGTVFRVRLPRVPPTGTAKVAFAIQSSA